jgi:hypothetical protein
VRPSPLLYGTVRQGRCQLRDTVPPLSYGRRAAASKEDNRTLEGGDGRLLRARPGPRRDVGPVRRVSSVVIGPAAIPAITTPSRVLQRHPRRCGVTGRQDAATPAVVRPTASRQLHPRVSVQTTTKWKISTPPPSKPLLDGHRARHDAPPGARFVGTAVHSIALLVVPSHVARAVRHACKLPPPWPIKGGVVPWPRGDDREHSPTHFLPSPRYWHSLQSKPQGPGGSTSSPALLVAPLCKHHGATQYSASSTSLLDVRPRPEPG